MYKDIIRECPSVRFNTTFTYHVTKGIYFKEVKKGCLPFTPFCRHTWRRAVVPLDFFLHVLHFLCALISHTHMLMSLHSKCMATDISFGSTKTRTLFMIINIVQRLSRAGPRGRARERATLGVHPLSWLLSNNRLEEVCGTLTKGTFSSRLLLSNQDKGCTPSVAHSLPLPLPPIFCSTCQLTATIALHSGQKETRFPLSIFLIYPHETLHVWIVLEIVATEFAAYFAKEILGKKYDLGPIQ